MSSDENYKKRQFLERELQEISKKKLKILKEKVKGKKEEKHKWCKKRLKV